MKTAREAAAAREYVPAGGVTMQVRQDRYINTTVTREKIEDRQKQQPGRKQNRNSGGSGHF